MKKFVKTIAITLLATSSISYANQYYMISSDSNNCKIHRDLSKKGYVYVTGSDCLCVEQDEQDQNQEWDESLSANKQGCFPVKNFSQGVNKKIISCDAGDHCNQYQCLKSYFYDNTENKASQVLLSKAECVDANKKPLGFCDANGDNCQ